MDVRRLRLLVELARLGSMREVADECDLTTSTVSHQLAVLAREAGAILVEPDGRRVRLTPAGRRLADHAVTILAAVDLARRDLDPTSRPRGTVRVGGFASAIRRSLLPAMAELSGTYPEVSVRLREFEPLEAFALLEADELDLALTYDYSLAPAVPGDRLQTVGLWTERWGLGVPADAPRPAPVASSLEVFRTFAEQPWIVNSRNTADEQVVRTLSSMAGCAPVVEHQIDSLELVQELIVGGLGVGLLPMRLTPRDGVAILPLDDPAVEFRVYAATRRGRATWAPLRVILDRLAAAPAPAVVDFAS